jgi:diaminohydroxyphosphoribosylaminopyrimidine deaminase / 5-amino-6-(5-phosphoribosylamino)uracil reductase
MMDRPTVTVSYAQTLDGRLATSGGSSRWISCSESLRFAHVLRSEHDAVMVGAGTACKDDPRLTVRLVPGKDPLRVVVDGSLRTPLTAAVLANGAARGTVLAVTDRAPEAQLEGGAALITSLLRDRLVDRLAVCIAPKVLGSGIEAVGDLGVRELTDSLTLTETSVVRYGVDLVLDARVEYPNGAR